MIRRVLGAAFILTTHLFAGPPRPASDAAPDAFVPVPADNQHLGGVLATRMRANTEGFLEHINEKEILKDGSAAGLFLRAAANAFEYTDDAQLKKVMDRVARQVIAQSIPEDADLKAKADLLDGLATYGDETGSDEALEAARKIADSIVKAPGVESTNDSGAEHLVGPLVALYRSTGDNRFLQTAHTLTGAIAPSRDADGLTFADGMVDYYRHSGDEAVLKKAADFWRSFHPTITGAPEPSANTCTTAAWFELTIDLLRSTAEPGYADALEATLYNQLLAAQEPQTGRIYDVVPMDGTKHLAASSDVCAVAEAVALSDIPDALWGRSDKGIVIFNYLPGRTSVRLRRRATIQIYSEGNYPEEGDILLHIEPSRETRFRLQLRVPRWSAHFSVVSGATRVTGKPGDLVTLLRDWKKGDTVRISIEMAVTEHRDLSHQGLLALQRGPQVLVLDRQQNPELKGLNDAAWGTGPAGSIAPANHDTRMPASAMPERTFVAPGSYEGEPRTFLLTPFADAPGTYRTWLPKS